MKNKVHNLRQSAHNGRLQERATPVAASIASRLDKLDALEALDASPEAAGQGASAEPNTAARTTPDSPPTIVEKPVPDRLALDAIKDRITNLRPVHEDRARELACNIALLGIIQPIAIDSTNRLLAGDHRRRALTILRDLAEWPERVPRLLPNLDEGDQETLGKVLTAWRRFNFDIGVPVHRLPIDSAADPAAAKAIELSENTLRENFTKDEVKEAYKALAAAGYRHTVGRPKKGEKAIGPQLELLYGRAARTIVKYVAELRAEEQGADSPPSRPSTEEQALRAIVPTATLRLSKKGAGAITIPFASLDEFHTLIAALKSAAS